MQPDCPQQHCCPHIVLRPHMNQSSTHPARPLLVAFLEWQTFIFLEQCLLSSAHQQDSQTQYLIGRERRRWAKWSFSSMCMLLRR